MKQIVNIFLLFVALLFCSCGEFFNFETEEPTVDGLRLSHHEVDLIVGDSITFDVEFSPDTLPVSYYWQVKGDEDAIELAGRKVNALKEGQALVVVQAQRVSNEAVDVVADSCYVNVFEWRKVDDLAFNDRRFLGGNIPSAVDKFHFPFARFGQRYAAECLSYAVFRRMYRTVSARPAVRSKDDTALFRGDFADFRTLCTVIRRNRRLPYSGSDFAFFDE